MVPAGKGDQRKNAHTKMCAWATERRKKLQWFYSSKIKKTVRIGQPITPYAQKTDIVLFYYVFNSVFL